MKLTLPVIISDGTENHSAENIPMLPSYSSTTQINPSAPYFASNVSSFNTPPFSGNGMPMHPYEDPPKYDENVYPCLSPPKYDGQ